MRGADETERQAVIRQQIADTVGPFDGNDVDHGGLRRPCLAGGRFVFDGVKDIVDAQPVELKREGVVRPGLVWRGVGRLGGIDCEPVAVNMEEAQVLRGGWVLVDQGECRAGDARLQAQSAGQTLCKCRFAGAQVADQSDDDGLRGVRRSLFLLDYRLTQQFAEALCFQRRRGYDLIDR